MQHSPHVPGEDQGWASLPHVWNLQNCYRREREQAIGPRSALCGNLIHPLVTRSSTPLSRSWGRLSAKADFVPGAAGLRSPRASRRRPSVRNRIPPGVEPAARVSCESSDALLIANSAVRMFIGYVSTRL